MLKAFGVAFGAIIGSVFGIICAGFTIVLAVNVIDWWMARVRRREYERNPWSDGYVPAIFNSRPEQLPQAPPSKEIESWWIPIDKFDKP